MTTREQIFTGLLTLVIVIVLPFLTGVAHISARLRRNDEPEDHHQITVLQFSIPVPKWIEKRWFTKKEKTE